MCGVINSNNNTLCVLSNVHGKFNSYFLWEKKTIQLHKNGIPYFHCKFYLTDWNSATLKSLTEHTTKQPKCKDSEKKIEMKWHIQKYTHVIWEPGRESEKEKAKLFYLFILISQLTHWLRRTNEIRRFRCAFHIVCALVIAPILRPSKQTKERAR